MSSETLPLSTPASHLVVVHPEPSGQHTAQVVGIPDVRVTAGSKEEALAQVRQALTAWLATASWVQVQVSVTASEHPLQRFAGHSKDDPDFDGYLEEIRRYRQEVDQSACSSTSSTPTT